MNPQLWFSSKPSRFPPLFFVPLFSPCAPSLSIIPWNSWNLINAFSFAVCSWFSGLVLNLNLLLVPVSQSGVWILFPANHHTDISLGKRHYSCRVTLTVDSFSFPHKKNEKSCDLFVLNPILFCSVTKSPYCTTSFIAGKRKVLPAFRFYVDTLLFCDTGYRVRQCW